MLTGPPNALLAAFLTERYGIANLLAVYQPDTQLPKRDVEHFQAIHSFEDILPIEKAVRVS